MARHLRAPRHYHGVELTVHVLPGCQGLLLPGSLTTPTGSHYPCSPSPGSQAHSRRDVRGPVLHVVLGEVMLGLLFLVVVVDLMVLSVVKKMNSIEIQKAKVANWTGQISGDVEIDEHGIRTE